MILIYDLMKSYDFLHASGMKMIEFPHIELWLSCFRAVVIKQCYEEILVNLNTT